MKRFRRGLVFKAQIVVSLNSRLESNKEEAEVRQDHLKARDILNHSLPCLRVMRREKKKMMMNEKKKKEKKKKTR